jgi:hypothetical protein
MDPALEQAGIVAQAFEESLVIAVGVENPLPGVAPLDDVLEPLLDLEPRGINHGPHRIRTVRTVKLIQLISEVIYSRPTSRNIAASSRRRPSGDSRRGSASNASGGAARRGVCAALPAPPTGCGTGLNRLSSAARSARRHQSSCLPIALA